MLTPWGSLPKDQENPQLISEAISEAIIAHEQDPTAHLGAGESLEQHKTNEVVDHPAFSVLDDKLAYDRNYFLMNFADFDNYDHSSNSQYLALNSLYFSSPNSSGSQWFYAATQDMWSGSEFLFSKNPRFFTKFQLSNVTNQNTYFIVGERDEGRGFGFKVINNALSVIYYKSDFSEVATFIQNVSAYTIYKIELRVASGTSIEVYINNLLVTTILDCDFPTTNNFAYSLPWIDFKSTTTTTRELFIRDFYWEADF